ncbi:MAG: endonuclease domain-containing protein [Prevotellaceae bacterium]|nr:endonuclease domain-containing protein [Prevotellaceae bacterium]
MDREDYKYHYMTSYPDRYGNLKSNSRENRTYPTDAELVMWEELRRKALGFKFRRQQSIGDYIVDFACMDKKLIIEVDGEYHNGHEQHLDDNMRTDFLNKHGFYVLRFTNEMVMTGMEYVLDRIKEIINKL